MALKKLLVAFTTNREVEGEQRRVRFAAGKVVDLTDNEMELLDKLTDATGKLHYRSPINEGGSKVTESDPEIVEVPDFEGQDVPMDKKTVDQLKAYLTFHAVEFDASANKAPLLELAKKHEAGEIDASNLGDGGNADPDGGL